MKQITIPFGMTFEQVCSFVAEVASFENESQAMRYGPVTVVANPGDTSKTVQKNWEQLLEEEKVKAQESHGFLLHELRALDFNNYEGLIQYLLDMPTLTDRKEQLVRTVLVLSVFEERGFLPSEYCTAFDDNNSRQAARYLIVYALALLDIHWCLSVSYRALVDCWKEKFLLTPNSC